MSDYFPYRLSIKGGIQSLRGTSYKNPLSADDVAVVVDESPQEWGDWKPFGDTMIREADGLRIFLVVRDFKAIESRSIYVPPGNYKSGQFVETIIPNRYREYHPDKVGDYCGYCGTFNGRNGWDCCYCGGN